MESLPRFQAEVAAERPEFAVAAAAAAAALETGGAAARAAESVPTEARPPGRAAPSRGLRLRAARVWSRWDLVRKENSAEAAPQEGEDEEEE